MNRTLHADRKHAIVVGGTTAAQASRIFRSHQRGHLDQETLTPQQMEHLINFLQTL